MQNHMNRYGVVMTLSEAYKVIQDPNLEPDVMTLTVRPYVDQMTGLTIPRTDCFIHNPTKNTCMLVFNYKMSGWTICFTQVRIKFNI